MWSTKSFSTMVLHSNKALDFKGLLHELSLLILGKNCSICLINSLILISQLKQYFLLFFLIINRIKREIHTYIDIDLSMYLSIPMCVCMYVSIDLSVCLSNLLGFVSEMKREHSLLLHFPGHCVLPLASNGTL
jgi:hypothetical protein